VSDELVTETVEPEVDDVVEDDVVEDSWTPPTKDEWEKAQAAAKAARKEAASRRKWLSEHGIDPHTGKKVKADVAPPSVDKDAEARVKAVEARSRSALKAAVKAAIRAEGVDAEIASLVLPQIQIDELELDEEGEIDGLADQLDNLRSKYPKLFMKDEPVAPVRRKSTGGTERKDGEKPSKSYDQLLLESAGL
jgi:hypothetical protein